MDKDYQEAVQQAKANLADLKERGEIPDVDEWAELKKEIFTPAEISEMDLKTSVIVDLITARQAKGITQKELGELSGIKQAAIARLERGKINPTLFTLQKLLAPLGKKLAVIPM